MCKGRLCSPEVRVTSGRGKAAGVNTVHCIGQHLGKEQPMPVAIAQAGERHAREPSRKSQPGGVCLVVLLLSSSGPASQGTSSISLDCLGVLLSPRHHCSLPGAWSRRESFLSPVLPATAFHILSFTVEVALAHLVTLFIELQLQNCQCRERRQVCGSQRSDQEGASWLVLSRPLLPQIPLRRPHGA